MLNDLTGKNVVVTGGASGIGAAISKTLAQCGATVVVHYFSSDKAARQLQEEVEQSASANAGRVVLMQADFSTHAGVTAFVEQVGAQFTSLDILVNNTGDLVERHALGEITNDFWHTVMAVNLDSMMMVTRGMLPLLKQANEGASVVNLASLAGRKGGHAGSLAYSTAKGAVLTFTRSLAAELAADKIRVNAVAPGLILGSKFHATHTTQASADKTISEIPLQRAGNPMDVARAVAFLAAEYNGFITGATLDINGGVYMA